MNSESSSYASPRARKRRAKWRLTGMIKTATGCSDCGYAAHAAALQFDHTDSNKKANVSDLIRSDYSWKTIKEEINKCVVRCSNCHAVITAERREAMDPYQSWNVRTILIDSVLLSTLLLDDANEHSL
jgi:ribosomal protein L32